MAIPCVVECLMLSVVGGTGYTVPVVTSRVYLRARMCFCCSFQQFWMHVPYVWHPTSPGLTCCNTDAHACVLRALTVVDKIREAPGRYVLTPFHSLCLAHPRCLAVCAQLWLPTSIR